MNSLRKYHLYFIVSVVLFLILSLLVPQNEKSLEQYNLTPLEGRLLALAITIPLVLIWCLAFYGFIKFKGYADFIKEDKDGKALNALANGLGVLALTLPLTSILSSILRYFVILNPDLKPWTTIINNYFAALVALIVFLSIYKGTKLLKEFVKSEIHQRQRYLAIIALSALAVVFAFFVIQNPIGLISVNNDGTLSYTPLGLILALFRMVIFIVAWYFGFISIFHINLYKEKIHGILYKKSLTFLEAGIFFIIIGSIITQAFTFLGTRLEGASLGLILAIIFVFLILIAIGYILVALGAKKLKKLEEI